MTNQENPSATFPGDSPTDTVTLIDNRTGRRTTLPILDATVGPSVIDVRNLYGKAGYSYHPSVFHACHSGGKGRQAWRILTMRRMPRVNQDVLPRATFLGWCFRSFFHWELGDGERPRALSRRPNGAPEP